MPLEPSDYMPITRESRLKEVQRRDAEVADKYRDRLIALYGTEGGRKVRYAEAFELSKQGRQATVEELQQLFPK